MRAAAEDETTRRFRVPKVWVTILLAVFGFVAVIAWNSKADKVDVATDLAGVRSSVDSVRAESQAALAGHAAGDNALRIQDSAWKAEQRDITLELLCHQYPSSRRCR